MPDEEKHSVNRFEKFAVQGFRRLLDVRLELRPLCVLIGANGIGKTSLLDAFSLAVSSARGNLNAAIGELSGLPALITYDRTDALSLGISSKAFQWHPRLDYSLRIRPQGGAYIIEEEMLTEAQLADETSLVKYIDSHGSDVKYFDGPPVPPGYPRQQPEFRPTWKQNPLETSLSQVPKMFREPEEFRNRLASSSFYHVLSVEPRSPVRLPQPMRPAALPGRNGEDLVSCLFYLRETDRDRFDAVQDALHAAFPGFERLDFPPVAAGTLAMTWREKDFTRPLYAHQLSEGMLRFLWLATLLQSPGLTALTLLDEPEVSLHPRLLSLLAELLREAANRTQLIVATQSDRLVRFLEPSEVVVMDATDDGMAQLTWADQLDLDEWLKEYTLDEVWRMGLLGGHA